MHSSPTAHGLPAMYTRMAGAWPLLLGLAAMYFPSLVDLFNGLWSSESQLHGPFILCISLWLLYRNWPDPVAHTSRLASLIGWLLLVIGLLLYVIGRSQQILQFEIFSIIWILSAILLLKYGGNALLQQWFPLFFMLFMIPLPGTLVILLTMPMKMAVSGVTETLLYWAGYPIARNGVILQIAQYQLLVADACAGLQTLFTLEAMGLLYLNAVQYSSMLRNIALAVLIIPISFMANVIRVILLTLITYYFGESAGQGFLHQFAGITLFCSALLLIIGMDILLRRLAAGRSIRQGASI